VSVLFELIMKDTICRDVGHIPNSLCKWVIRNSYDN